MTSNKTIYWILAILSLASYAWIGFHMFIPFAHEETFTVCLFKNATGLACPSCGLTRAVLSLMTGDIQESLMINPLGMAAVPALIALPVWMITDALTQKNSLAQAFRWTEKKIKSQKAISIPFIALVLLNWGWNILKDL